MNHGTLKTAQVLDFPWGPCLREAGAARSNRATPTNSLKDLRPRRTVLGWCKCTTEHTPGYLDDAAKAFE